MGSRQVPRGRVYLASVAPGDPDGPRRALVRAMAWLGVEPGERVTLLPGWLYGDARLGPGSFTDPALIRAVVDELRSRDGVERVELSGNAGYGLRTRRMARRMGLRRLLRKRRVRLRPVDEARFARYQLYLGDAPGSGGADERHWDRVMAPEFLRRTDTLVAVPRLRYDLRAGGLAGAVWQSALGALRDEDLVEALMTDGAAPVADLLEVVDPDLVVVDALSMGLGGSPVTQFSGPLGAIVVADNAVAADLVCCRVVGVDPRDLEHLQRAVGRGFGPASLDDVELHSEVDLDVLARRVRGLGPSPVGPLSGFSDRFRSEVGRPLPWEILSDDEAERDGSAAVVHDWLCMSYDLPGARERMITWPRWSVLVGADVPEPRGERVIVVGDRAAQRLRRRVASVRRVVRVPAWIQRFVGGPEALLWYRLHGGRRGLAWVLGGSVSREDLDVAFLLATRGRVRSPQVRASLLWARVVDGWLGAMVRYWRNRAGVPVALARRIGRLRGRSWRVAEPEALRLRASGEDQEQLGESS